MQLFLLTITSSDKLFPAVIIILITAILFLLCFLDRARKKCARAVHENKLLQDHIFELEELINLMSAMGKMSYFIGNTNHAMLKNEDGKNMEMKLAEAYAANIHPVDRARFREQCRQLFAGEINNFNEHYTLNVKGKRRRHLDSAKMITLPHSKSKKIILSAMDITEIEQQHSDLVNADSILKAIFDNLPGYILLKDVSSNFAYERCNPSFSWLLQKSPSEIIGKSDFDLFDRQLAKRIRACDLQIVRTGVIADNRWFFVTPDGREHAIRFISRLIKRSDGSESILGFGVDVTRQEYITSKLRKKVKELRTLLAAIQVPELLADNKLNIICQTGSARQYFPENSNSASISCRELFACDAPTEECAALQAISNRCALYCNKCKKHCQQLCITPLLNDTGEIYHLLITPEEQPEKSQM